MSSIEIFWLVVGFSGQGLFTARFLVQWLASEKKGESVMPMAFWYLSMVGGWLLLAYAVYRMDPVIITGQAFGSIVYGRNLMLIYRKNRQLTAALEARETASSSASAPAASEATLAMATATPMVVRPMVTRKAA